MKEKGSFDFGGKAVGCPTGDLALLLDYITITIIILIS